MSVSENMKSYLEIVREGKNSLNESGILQAYIPLVEKLEKENEALKQQIAIYEGYSKIDKSEIKQLKQQIEKMKCCGNCENWYWSEDDDYPEEMYCNKLKEHKEPNDKCDKWELTE